MREEFVLMEHVKEALCFVSGDVRADLSAAARKDSPHRREYVLPDGVKNLRGFVRDPKATATGTDTAEGAQSRPRGSGLTGDAPFVPSIDASCRYTFPPQARRRGGDEHLSRQS